MKIAKLITFSMIIIVLFYITDMLDGQTKQVVFVTDIQAPYSGPALMDNGFFTEIVTEAFKRAGYTCNIKYMPMEKAVEFAKEGKADGFLARVYAEENEAFFVHSEPVFESEVNFYSKKGSNITFDNLSDLTSYRIGVIRDDFNTGKFDATDELNIIYISNPEDFIDALLLNRVDLILYSKQVVLSLLKHRYSDAGNLLDTIGRPLNTNTFHALFSRNAIGYDEKVNDFNRGLSKIIADGTLSAITGKHFSL